jgi:hypothetical protein
MLTHLSRPVQANKTYRGALRYFHDARELEVVLRFLVSLSRLPSRPPPVCQAVSFATAPNSSHEASAQSLMHLTHTPTLCIPLSAMEGLMMSALPTVLLSSMRTTYFSVLVTEGYSKEHDISTTSFLTLSCTDSIQKLVKLAFTITGGECEVKRSSTTSCMRRASTSRSGT